MQYSKNMQPLVHVIINILFVLGEGSAILRLYTKFFVLNNFGADDWAMALVSLVNIGQHAILYSFIEAGAGLPQKEVLEVDPTALNRMLKRLFVEEIWYLGLHFLIKMSFLLFFLRLSPSRGFRLAVFITIGANVFVTVGTWTLYCLQCIPIQAYWEPQNYPDVKCLPFAVSLWLPATALICVDWAIFILPLSTILSLHMTMKKRLQVLAVVCTGGASVVVSCLRLIVIHEFTVTTDFIYEVGSICIVSAAEIEVAILASNMPGMSAWWKARHGTLTVSGGTGALSGSGGKTGGGAGGGGGTGTGGRSGDHHHQLATFSSSRRTHMRLKNGGDDDDLLFTRRDNESDEMCDHKNFGGNSGEDNSSTRELTARGGDRKDSEEDGRTAHHHGPSDPAHAEPDSNINDTMRSHRSRRGTDKSSSNNQEDYGDKKKHQTKGSSPPCVVVSREIVVTAEARGNGKDDRDDKDDDAEHEQFRGDEQSCKKQPPQHSWKVGSASSINSKQAYYYRSSAN